jgi:hypothetical protein
MEQQEANGIFQAQPLNQLLSYITFDRALRDVENILHQDSDGYLVEGVRDGDDFAQVRKMNGRINTQHSPENSI